jgi:hypothetical protein
MARIQKSRRDRVFASLAVAGATLTGGIVSYSVAVASPVTEVSQVRSAALPEGRAENCYDGDPDLNWYRQRGDQMTSNQMLPNTISFRTGATDLLPAGTNPCGGGDNGGGGQGPSCLSEFGFDPEDYWAVLGDTNPGAASATIFAAPVNTLTALSANDIPTATGCDVTYEWTFSEVDMPFAGIIDYWNGQGGSTSVTGETSTSMTVSGLVFGQFYSAGSLYNLYLCGGSLALRVSDGINDYDIVAPPCSYYRFDTTTYSLGVGFKFEYKDPWNRDEAWDQAPDYLGPGGGNVLSVASIPTVKPNSPLTVTFKVTAPYTLRTGNDYTVNCADPSVSTTIFSATTKNAASTWVDPSPSSPRIYCLEEIAN